MGTQATVVFTDLHGSTAVFEAMGNALATETITHITSWITSQCEQAQGRVVKTLGDGVLALFPDSASAVKAVVALQRLHATHMQLGDAGSAMPIRVGLASGDVELVAGDCYGDAVNVGARLCDLCGPSQIWADASALSHGPQEQGVAFRILGAIPVRGRAEPCTVYQIEWREEERSDFLTMQADTHPVLAPGAADVLGREVELRWMDQVQRFRAFELPVHIGRVPGVEFLVSDPRVSRSHARLEWRNGSVLLVDESSYGSWVRFAGGGGADVLLRREACVLHGEGELALGASFADPRVARVHFRVL